MLEIKLHYWKDKPNFGDLLSPFIVEALAQQPVIYEHCLYNADLIGLGSHMQKIDTPQLLKGVLWGTGHMAGRIPSVFDRWAMTPHTAKCVRGKLTRDFWGLPDTVPLGDPGLLVPLIMSHKELPKVERGFTFIPHWQNERYYRQTFPLDALNPLVGKIVSPLNDPLTVIGEILKGEVLVASSLYAIILADAYGIPSLWVMPEPICRGESTPFFKYRDYFSSIQGDTRSSDPFFIPHNFRLLDVPSLLREARSAPTISVRELQNNLLKTFPYGTCDNCVWAGRAGCSGSAEMNNAGDYTCKNWESIYHARGNYGVD